MKTLLIGLLACPLFCLAQSESLIPGLRLPPPASDTLKPIAFREIPYTYTTSSTTTDRGRSHTYYTTHEGIRRIYSYDGIDVDNPQQALWRYMLALNDPDVNQQHRQFNAIVAQRQSRATIGAVLFIPGLLMFIAGAVQAGDYKKAVERQRSSTTPTYTLPTVPTPAPATGPTLFNCGSWIGYNGSWTCYSGPYSGQTVHTDPFAPTTTTQPATPATPVPVSQSATITQSNGVALGVTGCVAMLTGLLVGMSGPGNQDGTFLRAVQYYNRALKRTVSWEMAPYSSYSHAGLSVIGRF
ncbi:hypothetical protein GCM10027578_16440 [Spirosoma luteolum]